MAKLPDPVFQEIRVDTGEDTENIVERMKVFYSTLKVAVIKAEFEEKKNEDRREV